MVYASVTLAPVGRSGMETVTGWSSKEGISLMRHLYAADCIETGR